MSENHETLLKNLVSRMETNELNFYLSAARFNYKAWYFTATVILLSSIVTSAVAGLMDAESFKSNGRYWLVILPIIGAIASGVLHLFKFREKEALREHGRIELEDIIANAKSFIASATNEEDFKNAYHRVRERFHQFELIQHSEDTALRTPEITKTNGGAVTPNAGGLLNTKE